MGYKLIIGLLFLPLFLLSGGSFAQAGPVEVVSETIKTCGLKKFKTDVKLQNIVSAHIDFNQMAKSTMSKFAKKISAKDRKWYTKTLKTIIIKTVYPEAPGFLKNINFTSTKLNKMKDATIVNSIVVDKGEEIELEYFFAQVDKKWKIIDVAVDGSSWVEDIKEQVDEIWDEYKWSGVKRKLNKKIKELKK